MSDMEDVWKKYWEENYSNVFSSLSYFLPTGSKDFYWRWRRYKSFLKKVSIRNPEVLELGCGSGAMSFKIMQKYGGKFVLVDLSKESILFSKKLKQKRFKELDKNNIKYLNIDIFKLHEKKKYDLVHSQGLIEHFKEPTELIKKHIFLTKKRGYILILAPRRFIGYKALKKLMIKIKLYPDAYEKPIPLEKLISTLKKYNCKILKKRVFAFSYGVLAQKLSDSGY